MGAIVYESCKSWRLQPPQQLARSVQENGTLGANGNKGNIGN
jgi:hypothetical protein